MECMCIYITSNCLLSTWLCQVCGGELPYVAPESLLEKHNFFKCEALHHFSSIKKMGGKDFCAPYQAQLGAELNELWESFSKHNDVRDRNRILKIQTSFWNIFLILSIFPLFFSQRMFSAHSAHQQCFLSWFVFCMCSQRFYCSSAWAVFRSHVIVCWVCPW